MKHQLQVPPEHRITDFGTEISKVRQNQAILFGESVYYCISDGTFTGFGHSAADVHETDPRTRENEIRTVNFDDSGHRITDLDTEISKTIHPMLEPSEFGQEECISDGTFARFPLIPLHVGHRHSAVGPDRKQTEFRSETASRTADLVELGEP